MYVEAASSSGANFVDDFFRPVKAKRALDTALAQTIDVEYIVKTREEGETFSSRAPSPTEENGC